MKRKPDQRIVDRDRRRQEVADALMHIINAHRSASTVSEQLQAVRLLFQLHGITQEST